MGRECVHSLSWSNISINSHRLFRYDGIVHRILRDAISGT